MNVTTVGMDLAKNVLQVHGVDARGKILLRKQLRRAQVAPFFANLPPCLIGMEACASAHYWGRTLERFGHTVRLMAPQSQPVHCSQSRWGLSFGRRRQTFAHGCDAQQTTRGEKL